MDQAFKVLTLPDRGAQTPASGPHYISLEEMLQIFTGFLHRQYPVIGVAFLLIMALAAVYLFTTPPSFTAVAKLTHPDVARLSRRRPAQALRIGPPSAMRGRAWAMCRRTW